ncbi:phosphoenolpyruvate synthase [Candidatus Microgenomates bacterium]|nr:phosphoenolpyruvate synthase [Candidatus Microgenomates bacterium]
MPLIVDFKNIDKGDLSLVGGKGANLGEMTKAKFPVPGGFAVTVPSYELFLKENEIAQKIYDILKPVDVDDPAQLESASRRIQKIIISSKFPVSVHKELVNAYKKMSGRFKPALVAVRSSATAEDLPGMSFAGQQATFLNIKGENNLQVAVRECWASLFTPRAIYYRTQNKIPHEGVGISVIVQKMVQSSVSGTMFSIDPVTNFKDRIVIEAVWGLGEMIVQGSVVPDRYVVQKETFSILSKEVNTQKIQLIKSNEKTLETDVPKKLRDKIKLTEEEVVKLAKLADGLQKHYYFPQDIEWAKEGKDLYIVQTRPVTTIKETKSSKTKSKGESTDHSTPILTGIPASPGIGSGHVKILKSPSEIGRVSKGDILVAPMTSPDYVPAMKKAAAIVTDQGGMTSHAAIVSREMGTPAVVGTKIATTTLIEGDIVTVNGESGHIFMGGNIAAAEVSKKKADKKKKYKKNLKTATKIYVNLGEPELSAKVSKQNVDGVGLLRAEFMIANIGIHPKQAIKLHKQDDFVNKLVKDLTTFCKNFGERPVIYRATDFKTNEYRSLEGGKTWEPDEPNPMLGYRGAFRYVADPEVFNLELRAIRKVRAIHKNLHLMIPFVRSPEELRRVRRFVETEGFFDDPTFKFWMMVELPVNVILLDKFIEVGIDGVSVGSNDLTMLLQGTDRDNSTVASAFNERSPEVIWALKRVIRKCHKAGITASICGQAVSSYDELVEILVKAGITSLSVNPDAIDRVRNVVYEVEKNIGVK